MKEKDFQCLFGKWARSEAAGEYLGGADAFELKVVEKGRALPFSRLEEHQREALYSVKGRGLYYKIADVGVGKKPFDCFVLGCGGGWVCVMWYKRRQSVKDRGFYLIDVGDFVEEALRSRRKSLTEGRAEEIGVFVRLGC